MTTDIYKIKEVLDETEDVVNDLEKRLDDPEELKETSLMDLFKMDFYMMLMYLASSDGKITTAERDFMNTLFDAEISIQGYVKFIDEHDIYSYEFESEMRPSLKLIATGDLATMLIARKAGVDYDLVFPKLVNFLYHVGKVFISCSGDVNPQAAEDLETLFEPYIGFAARLSEYADGVNATEEVEFVAKKKGNSTLSSTTARAGSVYVESIYKVGVDIPAGNYKLFAVNEQSAYYAICRDPNCNSIIKNENFYNQAYVKIQNGQFLELKRCNAVPLDKAVMFNGSTYTSGEYLVGREIPIGVYKMQANSGSTGYYALETINPDGSRRIITNKNFSNAAYVQTSDGQILVLKYCTLNR